jgi:hypothetical protein
LTGVTLQRRVVAEHPAAQDRARRRDRIGIVLGAFAGKAAFGA